MDKEAAVDGALSEYCYLERVPALATMHNDARFKAILAGLDNEMAELRMRVAEAGLTPHPISMPHQATI